MDTLKQVFFKLYNTETKKKEKIAPFDHQSLKMYTCGPTVYDFAHIGNFRTYVFEDLLRKTIEFFGMKIHQVMNITDVDDKTIRGAIAKECSLDEYTAPYKRAFFEDLHVLNIAPAENYPKATDFIEEMIQMIVSLLDKGFAYKGADGSIYYAIDKFSTYGRLSHLSLDDLQEGASQRVRSDEYDKANASDFVLWKSYDPLRDGKIYWDSPFGPGRPGWHIECSAMGLKLLGETIDIHCGGVDNIFPHHENEIAQSEAFTGKPFVKVWAHSEHLMVDGKKMSKSLGNFYTLRDLLNKGYTGREIRYLLLQTHYRTQLNFTLQGLEGARSALDRIKSFVIRLGEIGQEGRLGHLEPLLEKALTQFTFSLADDLNISAALASLFDFIRETHALCDQNRVSSSEAKEALDLLRKMDEVLWVLPLSEVRVEIPKELQDALENREKARKERNFAYADELRDFISSQGYLIEDTPHGARLKKIND